MELSEGKVKNFEKESGPTTKEFLDVKRKEAMAYMLIVSGACVARIKATWEIIYSYRKVILFLVVFALGAMLTNNNMQMRDDITNLTRYSKLVDTNLQ